MSRTPVAALLLSAGIGVGALLAMATTGVVSATVPPTAPPGVVAAAPASTVPGAVGATVAPTTTVPAVVLPPGARGGSSQGAVVKPAHETWTPRRLATTTLLAVIALAAAGYAYGKLRSTPPRHPDLARHPDEVAG